MSKRSETTLERVQVRGTLFYISKMRFRVVPSDGQPFLHEQDAPFAVGATFFHPPQKPGTQGFFRVTAIEPSDGDAGETVVRVDQLDPWRRPGRVSCEA